MKSQQIDVDLTLELIRSSQIDVDLKSSVSSIKRFGLRPPDRLSGAKRNDLAALLLRQLRLINGRKQCRL
jgi:hypothetical protein